ncbi:MAG: questin oxidase family protein [Pseudonocardiaceae bacterium]
MNSTVDEALERMRGASPEHANGIPNHGPMAAEALTTLGCAGEEVLKWVDRYSNKLIPMPDATSRITHESWQESLGRHETTGDWFAFFRDELAEHSWETTLNRWLPRLIPGIMAAGTHGFIRTAHAVRALDDGPTQLRIEELGVALGYWAAFYQELPGEPDLAGDLGIDQALDQIPRIGQSYDPTVAMPREFVETLADLPGFPAAVKALTTPDSIPAAISTLTQTAARLYLGNADRYPGRQPLAHRTRQQPKNPARS